MCPGGFELQRRFTMRTEAQPCLLGRDETQVAIDRELIEGISEVDETKPPEVIPVEIGPARRYHDAISKVTLADKKHALDCQIVGFECCLATVEKAAMFIWRVPAAIHSSREIKRFTLATPATGPMFQFHE